MIFGLSLFVALAEGTSSITISYLFIKTVNVRNGLPLRKINKLKMKNKIVIFAMALSLGLVSCTEKKSTDATVEENAAIETDATETSADTISETTPAATDAPAEGQEISVKGEVSDITRGKDGYMATILGEEGKTYIVTVSIVNLKDPKQFKSVEKGQTIEATGEVFLLGKETGVRATSFKAE